MAGPPEVKKGAALGVAAVLALAAPLIMRWEGVRYTPYQDVVGVWTVCYGHTGSDVVPGRKYTGEECRALLDADMAVANRAVRRCIRHPMITQIEAALTDLVFNVGPKGVCGSGIQRAADANNWPQVCVELDKWKFAGGRVYDGLVNRRFDARYLCETGKYRWLD